MYHGMLCHANDRICIPAAHKTYDLKVRNGCWPTQTQPVLLRHLNFFEIHKNMKTIFSNLASIILLMNVTTMADELDTPSVLRPEVDSNAQKKQGLPQFDSDGAMILPDGYREWIFVGSAIGLGYKETADADAGSFSHVYINPFGYRAFRDTGKFPIGTVLMLETASRGEKENPALTGYYSDEFVGLEAAVKTGDRFGDPWTYYNFVNKDRKQIERAQRIESKSCIECHREHAKTDHVFTQFYPVLRSVTPKR